MKIAVIGTGYVGLVTGVIFADWGNEVVCSDVNKEKIDMLNKGQMPIYEDGLAELVLKNVKAKRLTFTHDVGKSIREADVVFIGVGTPQGESGRADLSAVWSVCGTIGDNLNNYKIIIIKSTVPLGTNEKAKELLKNSLKKQVPFDFVSNPEFLREGSAIYDANKPDRVVLGSDNNEAIAKIAKLYEHLGVPVVKTDFRSAELIKYASNAFLATKISFINEIAQICDRSGANVTTVADGMGYDKRIGRSFLNASLGFGGSCFPKDIEALNRTSSDQEYDFRLLKSVIDVNERQKYFYFGKILSFYSGNLTGKTFACLGAAFKNDTDDVRKSAACEIVKMLRGEGAKIRLWDPAALENAKKVLGNDVIYYAKDAEDAVKGSDGLCILTEWKEFANLDLNFVKENVSGKVIFDGRNMFDPEKVKKLGITYFGIGRG